MLIVIVLKNYNYPHILLSTNPRRHGMNDGMQVEFYRQ